MRYLERKKPRWQKDPLLFSTLNTTANKKISWYSSEDQEFRWQENPLSFSLPKRVAKISWKIYWNKFPERQVAKHPLLDLTLTTTCLLKTSFSVNWQNIPDTSRRSLGSLKKMSQSLAKQYDLYCDGRILMSEREKKKFTAKVETIRRPNQSKVRPLLTLVELYNNLFCMSIAPWYDICSTLKRQYVSDLSI